jgi:diguanylate cyclase (GGDEF)-like protein
MARKRDLDPGRSAPEAARNAALYEKTSGLLSLGAAICFFVRLQIGSISDTTTIASSFVCIIMFIVYICIKRQWVERFSGVLLICAWVSSLLIVAALTEGSNSPVMVLAPITPLMAAVLRGRDWGWYSSIIIVVGIFIFGALEERGYYLDASQAYAHLELDLYEFWLILSVLIGALIGHHMARENTLLNETLRRHARIDFLTGIPNRLSVEESLDYASRESKRNTNWLSVMMIDIDHFKKYNDINGHAAGDKVLRQVAETLQRVLRRPYDFVGRYGGEEFSVILPKTDPEGARFVAEKMRDAIEKLKIPYRAGNKEEVVTVTIGLASAPGALDGRGDRLVAAADDSLYTGKNYGRNRVIPTVLDQAGEPVPKREEVQSVSS